MIRQFNIYIVSLYKTIKGYKMQKLSKLPLVSIILLNWNGWQDTVECLESLYRIDYPNYDVILVDNASNDNSVNKIKEYCAGKLTVESSFFEYNLENKPINILEFTKMELENENKSINAEFQNLNSNKKIILIKNDANYGFAEGNNIGIKYALKTLDPDYILLLNNDTVVDKKFLKNLMKIAIKTESAGFLGPKSYYYNFDNRKDVINFAGGKLNLLKGHAYHIGLNEIDNGQYDTLKEVDYIEGSSMLLKSKMVKEIGLMDTSYFAYWEEVDWCMRGHKSGYKSIYIPKSRIWHKVSASSDTCNKTYLINRNRLWFMKKFANKLQMFSFLMYFFGFDFWIKIIDMIVANNDSKLFRCFLRGVWKGISTNG